MSNNSSKNGIVESPRDNRLAIIILIGFLFVCSSFLSKIFQNYTDSSDEKAYDLQAELMSFYSAPGSEKGKVLTPFFFTKLPVNKADKALLMTVKGIGPALAESIIQNRFNYGFFSEGNDLLRVKGIGKKRAEYFQTVFDFGVE